MNSIGRRTLLLAAALLLLAVFPLPALATTSFSGAIEGDVVWTKEAGPYVVGSVTILSGSSLTILPGTVIKVEDGHYPFSVAGTLTVGGDGERVTITSIHDDSVGGDTNGDDTATVPNPGDWRAIALYQGSAVAITNSSIKYGAGTQPNNAGGHFPLPLIDNYGGTLALNNTEIAHGMFYGIRQH